MPRWLPQHPAKPAKKTLKSTGSRSGYRGVHRRLAYVNLLGRTWFLA
jgi:hypothetical protein